MNKIKRGLVLQDFKIVKNIDEYLIGFDNFTDNDIILLGGVLNIYSVYHGIRRACLLEPAGFYKGDIPRLLILIKTLKLHYRLDDISRILVSKHKINESINSYRLGQILGFYPGGETNNWFDYYSDRIIGRINICYKGKLILPIAEVWALNKFNTAGFKLHIRRKQKVFKKLFEKYGFKVTANTIIDYSYSTRCAKLLEGDKSFVKKYIDEYNNDMWNHLSSYWVDLSVKDFMSPYNVSVYLFLYKEPLDWLVPVYTGRNMRKIDEVLKKIYRDYIKRTGIFLQFK